MTMVRIIVMTAAVLLLAACTPPPETEPTVIKTPVDAFNAVGRPYTPHNGRIRGSLGTDIQRLQEAHRLYELSRDRRRTEVKNSQQQCLEQSDSRKVPIKGAAAPGVVFCEPSVK